LPISSQKFKNTNTAWRDRAGTEDKFRSTSLKYGSNPDLKPSKVKFQWNLNDTQGLVKTEEPPNNGRISNQQNSQWKFFNSFEKNDLKTRTREILKDEINNIAFRIAKAREMKEQMN
jgi:hypothetical protein